MDKRGRVLSTLALVAMTSVIAAYAFCATTSFDSEILVKEADKGDQETAVLHFDASQPENEIFHGSTGFLYGISEAGVPSANLIEAIAPKNVVQKAADGQQHPSGDGYRLTSYLDACGVENIQIYLQDYYLQWPYETQGIEDYQAKVRQIVSKMVKGKSDEELQIYSFVLFNEPDNIWYSGKFDQFLQDWVIIYQTVKEINPVLQVAGPNFSEFDEQAYAAFFAFCKKNACLPEYITWHDLSKEKLSSFESEYEMVEADIAAYYKDSGIEPVIFVNESVNFNDIGAPGPLVNWISIFEEKKVYASLPYWGLANSLNELAADSNKPNGAWWVYRWYAQMTGKTLPISLENVRDPGAYGRLYGLASIDEEKKIAYTLFGGQDGKQTICIDHVKNTELFKSADGAYVKVYRSKYTGQQGFADETPVVFEKNIKFDGDKLVFSIEGAELLDAYFAIIMPEISAETELVVPNWQKTYEAENGIMLGLAKSYVKAKGTDLARSNRAEVGNMNQNGDGVLFDVEVPEDGRYRMNVYYSNQAAQVDPVSLQFVMSDGQNRAIGSIVKHNVKVDGNELATLEYDSTVKWGYYNYKTIYINLKKGKHEISVIYTGNKQNGKEAASMKCALLDKIDLTLENDENATVVIEPEELIGNQKSYSFIGNSGQFSGAGAAEGNGKFVFCVCAPKNGLYRLKINGKGTAMLEQRMMQYADDAKAQSEVVLQWNELASVELDADSVFVYLAEGINTFALNGEQLILDQIIFSEEPDMTELQKIVVEAENASCFGQKSQDDNYKYLIGQSAVPEIIESAYASNGKAIDGFRGGKENSLGFEVSVSEDGFYKLLVRYANDEPAPVMKTEDGKDYVHPYNTDLVERYAQISINGDMPQTIYFRNTLCWDVYRDMVVDVKLKKGKNQIVISNDNSYKFSQAQDDFTPRLDRFEVCPTIIDEKR